MPAVIFAPIKITNINTGGVVNFGGTVQICPKSASKSFSGAAAGNNGDLFVSISVFDIVANVDPDLADENTLANN